MTARHLSRRRWQPGRPHRRLLGLALVTLTMMTAVVIKVGLLQTIDRPGLAARGEQQLVDTVKLTADRGVVFDRNMYELAMSVPHTSVWADPRLVTNTETAATALADILGIDRASLLSKLQSASEFVWIAREVDDDVATQIKAMSLNGVFFLPEPKRVLPAADLARGVLGQTDIDGKGISGVEKAYNGELTGTTGSLVRERDGRGDSIPGGQRRFEPARPGSDVVLTLDRNLQYSVEQMLINQVRTTKSKGGMVVVMRPNTGEVLAIANVTVPPSPEGAIVTPEPVVASANMALVNVFEPGSVVKVITAAAALQQGVADPLTPMYVPDTYALADDAIFTDAEKHPTASWNLSDILTKSSNVGTIMIAQRLKAAQLDHYLRAFGLGQKTALAFPNESGGILPSVSTWTKSSMGSIPIGQGVAVTAIQMLQAFNVIAAGGDLVSPTLVAATINPDGKEVPAAPAERHRVVSEDTAATVNQILQRVVAEGTGKNAQIAGYTVAGKTGTARKPQDTGTYEDTDGKFHYVSTFAGFAPAERPQISTIVVLDEPQGSGPDEYFAGTVAAPLFAKVTTEALRQLQIPPYRATPAG
jgi:cell division protein FtsI (penicillin-binding protein 3)